ncbi:MAG: head GIN domain-containing protein [Ferruginibacter sp.]
MKNFLFLVVSMISLGAFAQENKVINDANAVTRSVSGNFTGISVSGGIDVYLTQGNEESVAVSASEQKYLDRLITEVVNGTLKIYYDNKGISWRSNGKANLKAYVSFKALEKLNVSAGSDVTVNGSIKAGKLDLRVTSGAEFTGSVNVQELVAEVNSGADAKLSGSADKFTVNVSSGASFKGYEFAVDYCDASASSGADVHVTINKELVAKASSGGDIHYKGTGLIRDIQTNSGGAVKKVK